MSEQGANNTPWRYFAKRLPPADEPLLTRWPFEDGTYVYNVFQVGLSAARLREVAARYIYMQMEWMLIPK